MLFICFSSANRYTAVKSCLYHLKRYGVPVWYDYHELVLGDDKEKKNFQYAIECAEYFVVIYSKEFFCSPSALREEKLIFKKRKTHDISIFPILYNITINEIPESYQLKISDLIYNEITDATGSLSTINQIVCRMLLKEYQVSEVECTPTLYDLKMYSTDDAFTDFLINRYRTIDPENFNSRATLLLCLFKYLTMNSSSNIPSHHEKTVEYLTGYTNLNVQYNHKELTILELIVLLALRDFT